MMIVWIIIELMFLFTFFNLPPVGEIEEAKDIENSYNELESNRSSLNGSISEQNIIDVTEVSPLLKYSVHLQRERQVTMIDISHKTNSVTACCGCITWMCQKIQYLFILIKGLVYEESVLLLSILFIVLFNDLVIEVRRLKCLYVRVLVYYITCKPDWFLCIFVTDWTGSYVYLLCM